MHYLRPQVNRFHDLLPAPFHSPVLEVLANPVEQHNAHGFRIFANQKRADGRKRHQEVFIKHMAFGQIPKGRFHHILAQQIIAHKASQKRKPGRACIMIPQTNQQHGCTQQKNCLFLFVSTMTMVFFMTVGMLSTAACMLMGVMVSAATCMLMAIMMPTTTRTIPVATAAAFMIMMMVMMYLFLSGSDEHFPFHGPGNLCQFRDQNIRVLCGQPQLLCGKGNDCFLYSLMIIKFLLDLRRAIGTVQIFQMIDLLDHKTPSSL